MTETIRTLGNCKECDQPLVRKGAGPAPTYCSGACRAKAGNRRAKAEGRDKDWAATAAAKRQAEREAEARPCPHCGDPMANPRRVQCGKPECKRAWQAARMREWQQKQKAETGQWYHRRFAEAQREGERRRYESRKAAGLPVGRSRYPAAYAKADAKRRMLKDQATVETFDPQDIFERDGWICQLCHRHVDANVAWPSPMSATLDHTIPLSEGGDHSRANCRLAHLGCNSSRGNRGGGEQLTLIG